MQHWAARGSVRRSTGGGAEDGGAYGAAAQGTATPAAAQCGAAPAAAHGAQQQGDGGARPRDGGVRLSGQRDTAARQPAVGGGGQGHGAAGSGREEGEGTGRWGLGFEWDPRVIIGLHESQTLEDE